MLFFKHCPSLIWAWSSGCYWYKCASKIQSIQKLNYIISYEWTWERTRTTASEPVYNVLHTLYTHTHTLLYILTNYYYYTKL